MATSRKPRAAKRSAKAPAVAVGIKFQALLEVAFIRDGATVDRLALSTPDDAHLYSITDARRWLTRAQKAIDEQLTIRNTTPASRKEPS